MMIKEDEMDINNDLAALFTHYYEKMKREGSNYIPDTQVAKRIMLPMYKRFVREGLKRIENLEHEDKISLVEECRMTGEKFTNKTLTEQCKILYLIKTIMK